MSQDTAAYYPVTSQAAVDYITDSHYRDSDGRYVVAGTPFGARETAIRQYLSDERSLRWKQQQDSFHYSVEEYLQMGNAEKIPPRSQQVTFYMHGVVKDTSSTTRLQIVFDGSVKSSSSYSLKCPGPSLYPFLFTILNRFHLHKIGMSRDISKMFREVGLFKKDHDLHRFLHRYSAGNLVCVA